MNAFVSLVAVVALLLLAYLGVAGLQLHVLFGVVVPYVALLLFLGGVVYRVMKWASVPVPFRIPTTCGQQKSLPWIKHSKLENPASTAGVVGRMALEVLLFRSLFRNTRTEVHREGPKVVYHPTYWLWLGALAFHYCFLTVFVRHFRFFVPPACAPGQSADWCSDSSLVAGVWHGLGVLEGVDGFLQVGAPPVLVSGVVLLAAVTYLLLRRFVIPQVRYISLASDYFPLFLIIGIASTGLLLRHFVRTDIEAVKALGYGIASFAPLFGGEQWAAFLHPVRGSGAAPVVGLPDIHWLFFGHLLLVSTLFAYFPFSKLMHMGGVFLSPTRNMANTNRAERYDVGWSVRHPVPVHSYEEWEDEFREKMKMVGIPVDKE